MLPPQCVGARVLLRSQDLYSGGTSFSSTENCILYSESARKSQALSLKMEMALDSHWKGIILGRADVCGRCPLKDVPVSVRGQEEGSPGHCWNRCTVVASQGPFGSKCCISGDLHTVLYSSSTFRM